MGTSQRGRFHEGDFRGRACQERKCRVARGVWSGWWSAGVGPSAPGCARNVQAAVGCLCWPRGHEPGAAAEARPAVPGSGARQAAECWASGRWGLAGIAQLMEFRSCVGYASGVGLGGCIVALDSGRAVGCFERISCGSCLGEYM